MKPECTGWVLSCLIVLCLGADGVRASEHPAGGPANTIPENEYRLWYRNYDSPPIRALVALAFQ